MHTNKLSLPLLVTLLNAPDDRTVINGPRELFSDNFRFDFHLPIPWYLSVVLGEQNKIPKEGFNFTETSLNHRSIGSSLVVE